MVNQTPQQQQHRQRQLRRKRRRIIRYAAVIIGALGLLALWLYPSYFGSNSPDSPDIDNLPSPSNKPIGELPKGTPEYDTLLPDGKSAEDVGGWTRISPPDKNDVYAYVDRIDSVTIQVSQQPLPDDLADTLESLTGGSEYRNLTIDGTDVSVGTSAEGPQQVIFTKSDLLILIKSDSTLSDQQWTEYIGSLR